jgi:GNAT superfamily N-acetyltransferase
MPEVLLLESSVDFSSDIWLQFKRESLEISERIIRENRAGELTTAFDVLPITPETRHLIPIAEPVVEREFPRHGASMHFLLSTLPLPGIYDPILKDHAFHNSLQYWVLLDKQSRTCAGTCGIVKGTKDHADSLWAGWMVLAPEYRNRGLGRGLVMFTVAFSQLYGARHGQRLLKCVTSDEPHVKPARTLYASFGARETASFPNPYVPGHNAIIVEYTLPPLPQDSQLLQAS